MTLAEWLERARSRLAHVESPTLEAQLLAAHVLGVDRSFVLSHPTHDFPSLAGEPLLQRRERNEPLAYILGRREFYGRSFRVGPGVLIPRQETETLLEAALELLVQPARVLDLGTGSGALAVSIALERPEAEVTASDISATALAIAEDNAAALGAEVRFVLSDGFASLLGEAFDLIVTNPPYIGLHEPLPAEVGEFEPQEALFAGPTGFEFYQRLADKTMNHLADGGTLLMEVGYRQASEVAWLFKEKGWAIGEVLKDLSGVERVIAATYGFPCAA